MQSEGRASVEGPLAGAFLDHLGQLRQELSSAMEAIGANALARFEDSVSRQQLLCAHLQGMAERMSSGAKGSESLSFDQANPSLAERIVSASESLHELNLQYAALLAHSTDSVRLLAGLCRSYSSQIEPLARRGGGIRGAWSCEL